MLFIAFGFSAPWIALLLAVLSTFGYLLGRRRPRLSASDPASARRELARALSVAQELEAIARRVESSLRSHAPALTLFDKRLKRNERGGDVSWQELCDWADELLKPALRLSTEVSHAYAELLQQMGHLSTFADLRTDPLTGVSNRRAFDDAVQSCLSQATRNDVPLSVAMLDIDFFKTINDQHGHLQGDRALQELAKLLRETVRECDILARYGGEEFVILMPQTQLHGACQLAERLRALIDETLPFSVSIGLAAALANDSVTTLLGRADAALYAAKEQGRNRVCYHEGPSGRIVAIHLSTDNQPVVRVAHEDDNLALAHD